MHYHRVSVSKGTPCQGVRTIETGFPILFQMIKYFVSGTVVSQHRRGLAYEHPEIGPSFMNEEYSVLPNSGHIVSPEKTKDRTNS